MDMKMSLGNKLTLLLFLLISGCAGEQKLKVDDGRKENEKKFAFVFLRDPAQHPQDLNLFGTIKPDTMVTLIGISTPETCKTSTTGNLMYEDEVKSFPYTTLRLNSCEDPRKYSMAIINEEVKSYSLLQLKKIDDQRTISRLHELVLSSNVLKEMVHRAQDEIDGDYSAIVQRPPNIYQYPIAKVNAYIVEYGSSGNNPRVIVLADKIYPFTGWCSYEYMKSFNLNGRYYIESGSSCCTCGGTSMELYEVKPGSVRLVHEESSLSD
jgi:hypothetical protein